MGVCFEKQKFVFKNRSLKVEVCFRKSELKIRICCRKSEFDVGACCMGESRLSLGPRLCGGVDVQTLTKWRSMLKQRRQENNLSEPDPKRGQRSPRNALQKKEEKKENRTRNHLSTFNQKCESQDHKRNQNENAAKVKHFQKKKIEQSEETLKALNRHSQRGTCPKTLQYKARADEAFKTDINKIRRTTEQEVVNYVLTPSSGTMNGGSLNARTLKQQKRPILN